MIEKSSTQLAAMEFLLASVLPSVLIGVIPAEVAQTAPEQAPPSLNAPANMPANVPVEDSQSEFNQIEPESDPASITCAPDQFPSAFSDVLPTDWAYQAVIRLSSRPIECFDYTAENSPR
ncbi:MAG: hypothetical protein AAF716_00615 [Cyanobacteria bacterium P01_D01_bin.1]